jgi:hypothetical protein
MQLLYSAHQSNFSTSEFHQSCDSLGPTLIFIKSKGFGKVFGGYSSKPWSSEGLWELDSEAFLFSVTDEQTYV